MLTKDFDELIVTECNINTLDLVYGKDTASIIVDNCNQQTFLGSQSQETKERFSKECGKKTVTSIKGVISGDVDDVVEIPVVQITSLDQIQPGEMYTKRIYSPILKCSFIRSYQCANQGIFKDFYNAQAEDQLIPLNYAIPDDLEHSYLPVLSDIEIRRLSPSRPKRQTKERVLINDFIDDDDEDDEEDEAINEAIERDSEFDPDRELDEFFARMERKMKKGKK